MHYAPGMGSIVHVDSGRQPGVALLLSTFTHSVKSSVKQVLFVFEIWAYALTVVFRVISVIRMKSAHIYNALCCSFFFYGGTKIIIYSL